MKTIRHFISVAAAFTISSVMLTIDAQVNGPGSKYIPEVGQQGKDVVWVPTPQELVNKMLEIGRVTPDDYVIDLGSGDGRTVISAAKIGAKAVGIEYNADMVALSKENAKKEGVGNKTEFLQADLYETDLSKATVITMFLLPEINLKLRPRLLDLKPGTRIVSNTFTMGEWEADMEVTTEENWNSWNTAYLWIIPAKIGGKWKLGDGELELVQEYQFVRGTFKAGIRSQPVTDGRLEGNKFTFKISDDTYTGVVSDVMIKGTATNKAEGKTWDWTASRQ
ncbi:MAG: methyltransferase domain-containing protein [Bacteroidales bacterium]|jgi:SAM-dependent methyltransferase|nr:methyltransferase domain-containing protein [Bacteroidales bacterium]